MKDNVSGSFWKLLIAGGAVLLVIMAVFTVRSFNRLAGNPPPPSGNGPVSPAATAASIEEEEISAPAPKAFFVPAPFSVSSAIPAVVQPQEVDAKSGSQKIEPSKPSRAEMIATMRKWAREHATTNKGNFERRMRPTGSSGTSSR